MLARYVECTTASDNEAVKRAIYPGSEGQAEGILVCPFKLLHSFVIELLAQSDIESFAIKLIGFIT